VKLQELVPDALLVLEGNLRSENENIRQRAAEHVLDRAWGRPVTPTRDETRDIAAVLGGDVGDMSDGQLRRIVAGDLGRIAENYGPVDGEAPAA
jgi:hypothetical protein